MIDVEQAIRDVPHFERFCSVQSLHELTDSLKSDRRFHVRQIGASAGGVPIHHVRFGTGSVKALFVAFPHCMEPIGGLTVFSLMTLLRASTRALLEADVEWHIVPCVDPDGASLNEGWSQRRFSLERYMKYFYLQAPRDQVDNSFPLTYKKLNVDRPSVEARVLKDLMDEVRPDFYFPLHNARSGGGYFCLSRDIDHRYYEQLYALLRQFDIPVNRRPGWREFCEQYGEGIVEVVSVKKYYDYIERTTSAPEQAELVRHGACSWEYLAEIKPEALTFVAEVGYVRHPAEESDVQTGQNLRQFKLRVDADSKFLATMLLEEWENVKDEVDSRSPFYRSVVGGGTVLPTRARILEGGFPLARYPLEEVLFKPEYDRPMTEADRIGACIADGGFLFLLWTYPFVRLLKASPRTPRIMRAEERLEKAYDHVLAEIASQVNFDAFKVFECDVLAKTQLGAGLIALNSLLQRSSQG